MSEDTVKYIRVNGGYQVSFPFDLLSIFKETFKTAKWNKEGKFWHVGVKDERRLVEFAEESNKRLKGFLDLREAAFNATEIESLRIALDNLNQKIISCAQHAKKKNEEAGSLSEIRQQIALRRKVLEDNTEILKKAEKELEEKRIECQAEQDRLDQLIGSMVDIHQLKGETLRKFRNNHKIAGPVAHRLFDEAQAEFIAARNCLAKHGFKLRAFNWLSDANFNRSDRDAVDLMPPNFWYEIEKIPQN